MHLFINAVYPVYLAMFLSEDNHHLFIYSMMFILSVICMYHQSAESIQSKNRCVKNNEVFLIHICI